MEDLELDSATRVKTPDSHDGVTWGPRCCQVVFDIFDVMTSMMSSVNVLTIFGEGLSPCSLFIMTMFKCPFGIVSS